MFVAVNKDQVLLRQGSHRELAIECIAYRTAYFSKEVVEQHSFLVAPLLSMLKYVILCLLHSGTNPANPCGSQ